MDFLLLFNVANSVSASRPEGVFRDVRRPCWGTLRNRTGTDSGPVKSNTSIRRMIREMHVGHNSWLLQLDLATAEQ